MSSLRQGQENRTAVPEETGSSWGHSWEPRTKTVVAVILVIAVVSLNSLSLLFITFLLVLGAALSMKMPGRFLAAGLLRGGTLVFLMAVTIVFGNGIPPEAERLYFAGLLSLKGLISITTMIMLLGTQPVGRYFDGLARLGLPPVITSVLFLAYRYFFLMGAQLTNTQRAAAARAFKPGTNTASFKIYGEMAGGLFIKAIDRSEKVSRALAARGFAGRIPTGKPAPVTGADILKCALTLGGAVVLVILDWRWPL